MAVINLTTGIIPTTQIPLDDKRYFKRIIDLIDLGISNHRAFYYYDSMIVICAENRLQYIWREQTKDDVVNQSGLIENGFLYPESSEVDGIIYSNKIYNFFLYAKPIVPELTPKTIVIGGIVTYVGPGLKYITSPIDLDYLNESYNIASAPFTLVNGDNINDRFDIFILNLDTQIVEVIPGITSENPQIPYYDVNTQYLLSTIRVTANAVEPEVLNTIVYAENLQEIGGEWDVLSNNDSVFDSGSILSPDTGAVSIYHNDEVNSGLDEIYFVKKLGFPTLGISSLFFRLKKGTADILRDTFTVRLIDANNNVVSQNLRILDYAVIDQNDTEYQDVVIPWSAFQGPSEIFIIAIGFRAFYTATFIDNVQLVYNVATPPSSNTWVGLLDTFDTSLQGKEGWNVKVIDGKIRLVEHRDDLVLIATADQTNFPIPNPPDSIERVFKGRNLSLLTDEYTYVGGEVIFGDAVILGTRITIIFKN